MAEVITSTANGTVKAVRALHRAKERRQRAQTIIEGPTVLGEFLNAAIVPVIALCMPNDIATQAAGDRHGFEVAVVTENVLTSASETRTPRGPVCVIALPGPAAMSSTNTLVLVDISDPGNVGTMIRTAAALGWNIAVSGTTADPWSPKTIRAGAGAHVHTAIAMIDDPVGDVVAAGVTPVAAVVSGGVPVHPFDAPVGLLVGSEAHGLDAVMVDRCSASVGIPMPGGVESLNAAVAASIAMYAISGLARP